MDDSLKKAIQQMKNGEETGFNAVYSATYNRVYFRAKQIMKKEEDAQDLTQIVFVEAYKNIHTLQAAEALYSWLDGITYNQGMKIYRKQRDVLLTEEAEGMFDILENNDISFMPELTADQKATAEIVKGIIEELPELQKAAVVAYYFDGLKVERIAELMECSVNTIKSRLNYARKYIKERVEEKEKKEGYRLHVLGLPVLWYAIRTMSDRTSLTAQAAQTIYNGACSGIGLQASAITAGGAVAAEAVTAAGVAAAEAATTAATTAGAGAKAVAISTTVKALLIAGAVIVAGAGIAGAISVINHNRAETVDNEFGGENDESESGEKLTLEDDLSEYLGLYFGEYWREDAEAAYPYKVSDTEYRFRPEDLQKYGDMVTCSIVKDKMSGLPEGVELAVAYCNSQTDLTPDMLVPQYLYHFTADSFTFQISTAEGFIIRLVDTSVKEVFDAWELEEDYSEFIKMYEVAVSEPYVFEYQYDGPTLTAEKVSDGEYRFSTAALRSTFKDGQTVGIRLNLPYTIEFVSVTGEDAAAPETMIDYMQVSREDANRWYFTLSTGNDIIIKVKKFEGSHGRPVEEVEETKPKTIANVDNLREYEKWGPKDGSDGPTLYVKKIGSESVHIYGDIYETLWEYDGYWTLDGQEIHFTGKDLEPLTLTDMEGNPIDRRIAFYYLEEDGMIYVDIPDGEDWESYAFRDTPDYVYKKLSSPVLDTDEHNNTVTPSAENSTDSGVHLTNDGTTWQLTDTVTMHFENGVFTVSGEGEMPDYNARKEVAPWTYDVFRGDPTTVIIEEGVTSISPMAFSGYLNLTDVTLPGSLKKIGDRAFSSCSNLKEIVIPDGVEEIGDKVFFNSYSLEKIVIPASVTEIGDGIFMSGNSHLVIYGEKGSAAEQYAQKYEIDFKEM